MFTRSNISAAIVGLCVLCISSDALSAEYFPFTWSTLPVVMHLVVPVGTDPTFALDPTNTTQVPASAKTALNAAASAWNGIPGTDAPLLSLGSNTTGVAYSLIQSTTRPSDGTINPDFDGDSIDGDLLWCLQPDGENSVILINDIDVLRQVCACGMNAPVNCLHYTEVTSAVGGVGVEADMVLYLGNVVPQPTSDGKNPTTSFDSTEVPYERSLLVSAMHEFGHVLGLDHEDDDVPYCDLMKSAMPACGNPGMGGSPAGTPLVYPNGSAYVNTDEALAMQLTYPNSLNVGADAALFAFEREGLESREIWTPATHDHPRAIRRMEQEYASMHASAEDWDVCPGETAGYWEGEWGVTLPPAPPYVAYRSFPDTDAELTVKFALTTGRAVGDCAASDIQLGSVDVTVSTGIPRVAQLRDPVTDNETWCIPSDTAPGLYNVCAYIEGDMASPGRTEVYSDADSAGNPQFSVRYNYVEGTVHHCCRDCNNNQQYLGCDGNFVNWPCCE